MLTQNLKSEVSVVGPWYQLLTKPEIYFLLTYNSNVYVVIFYS